MPLSNQPAVLSNVVPQAILLLRAMCASLVSTLRVWKARLWNRRMKNDEVFTGNIYFKGTLFCMVAWIMRHSAILAWR